MKEPHKNVIVIWDYNGHVGKRTNTEDFTIGEHSNEKKECGGELRRPMLKDTLTNKLLADPPDETDSVTN